MDKDKENAKDTSQTINPITSVTWSWILENDKKMARDTSSHTIFIITSHVTNYDKNFEALYVLSITLMINANSNR